MGRTGTWKYVAAAAAAAILVLQVSAIVAIASTESSCKRTPTGQSATRGEVVDGLQMAAMVGAPFLAVVLALALWHGRRQRRRVAYLGWVVVVLTPLVSLTLLGGAASDTVGECGFF